MCSVQSNEQPRAYFHWIITIWTAKLGVCMVRCACICDVSLCMCVWCKLSLSSLDVLFVFSTILFSQVKDQERTRVQIEIFIVWFFLSRQWEVLIKMGVVAVRFPFEVVLVLFLVKSMATLCRGSNGCRVADAVTRLRSGCCGLPLVNSFYSSCISLVMGMSFVRTGCDGQRVKARFSHQWHCNEVLSDFAFWDEQRHFRCEKWWMDLVLKAVSLSLRLNEENRKHKHLIKTLQFINIA